MTCTGREKAPVKMHMQYFEVRFTQIYILRGHDHNCQFDRGMRKDIAYLLRFGEYRSYPYPDINVNSLQVLTRIGGPRDVSHAKQ
jgi:hypothetical protein